MAQIEVHNLTKQYRRKVSSDGLRGAFKGLFQSEYETVDAVQAVGFQIEKGETVGYIGPNGSGKSTTVKMLTGILRPTAGEVLIEGARPDANRLRNNRRIGVVFGQRSQLWWDVPVMESYRLLKVMYNVPEKRFQENLDMLTAVLGLGGLLNVPERQLSLGQKMRCNLAAALLHDPDILFLDEPTVGVDAAAKADARALLKKINEERGTTFILTSHDFQDIEALCRRIMIIDKGRILADAPIADLRGKFTRTRTIRFAIDVHGQTPAAAFAAVDGVTVLSAEPNLLALSFEPQKHAAPRLIEEVSQHCSITDISILEPSIESIVRQILLESSNAN